MKALQIIASIAVGIGIGLIIRNDSGKQSSDNMPLPTERMVVSLREGVFSPVHPDWQRLRVEVKKSCTNDVYEVTSSGSNGAEEPYEEDVFVVRQLLGQEELEIIGAYEYECVPEADSGKIKRDGGEMAAERRKLMSLIIKDDLLLVNGLAYRME